MAKEEQIGFLVPPWYVKAHPSELEINVASTMWGFSMGIAVFTAAKAARQSWTSWHRSHRVTSYVAMIWGEWVCNVIMAVLSWMNLYGLVSSGFWLWFFIVLIWCCQVQLLMQIIINRIWPLTFFDKIASRLKWSIFVILLLVNISVFIIWIPARLQISENWIRVNKFWDRFEKGVFLIVDVSLNTYFVCLIRRRLMEKGLVKYKRLFRFNLCMILISVSLDGALIGLLSLQTKTVYLQFQCFSYLSKLHIELTMAELVFKISQSSNKSESFTNYTNFTHFTNFSDNHCARDPNVNFTINLSLAGKMHFAQLRRDMMTVGSGVGSTDDLPVRSTHVSGGPGSEDDNIEDLPPPGSIQRTVVMRVNSQPISEVRPPRDRDWPAELCSSL